MIPSIDDRLDSMARAVQEAILPALASDRSLAIDQAHLLLAHIAMIRSQLDLAPVFERMEAEGLASLARELVGDAKGGEATAAAAERLRAVLATIADDQLSDVRVATGLLGTAIEDLIEASGVDGDASFKAASFHRIIAAGRITALRDRSWFQSAGFEASDVRLPSPASLLEQGSSRR